MRVWYLDKDPRIAANYLDDKILLRVPLTMLQLAGAAIWDRDSVRYKLPLHTYQGLPWVTHPAVQWVRQGSPDRFLWVIDNGLAACAEYNTRYGRRHALHDHLLSLRSRLLDTRFYASRTYTARVAYSRAYSRLGHEPYPRDLYTLTTNKVDTPPPPLMRPPYGELVGFDRVWTERRYYYKARGAATQWDRRGGPPDWWVDPPFWLTARHHELIRHLRATSFNLPDLSGILPDEEDEQP